MGGRDGLDVVGNCVGIGSGLGAGVLFKKVKKQRVGQLVFP